MLTVKQKCGGGRSAYILYMHAKMKLPPMQTNEIRERVVCRNARVEDILDSVPVRPRLRHAYWGRIVSARWTVVLLVAKIHRTRQVPSARLCTPLRLQGRAFMETKLILSIRFPLGSTAVTL
jgi:hypothetical protein